MKEDPVIVITKASRSQGNSKALKQYVEQQLNPSVFCKFCGRELKNPKSKELGYGQGCYKRWVKSRACKRSLIG